MTASNAPSILWFRRDLRIADNPALRAAISRGGLVIPIYIDNARDSKWSPGPASRWWLRHSLTRLDAQLRALGSRLVVRRGKPDIVLKQLTDELAAKQVFYDRRYDLQGIREQQAVERKLKRRGVGTESFNASLLFEPELIKNRKGEPFRVFTAFWRACMESPSPVSPRPAPKRIAPPKVWPEGVEIEELGLESNRDDEGAWDAHWIPGAEAAAAVWKTFAARRVRDYGTHRDRFDLAGTSRLSPYLHSGEISPHQVWHAIQRSSSRKTGDVALPGASAFLRQLGWREFAHYLLYHYPFTADKPLSGEYARFPWKHSKKLLNAWRRAETGYPIVDAGMRELAHTGWMHNRVRMVAASFLVKHLLIPWQRGARWFWDRLVDADLANNTLGWQWVAGCGADAAPYFRIFNPVSQGTKFDPEGLYVRKWIPELKGLPNRWIHCPWQAPGETLERAGVTLGRTYPTPIVDHMMARQRALSAYDEMKARG